MVSLVTRFVPNRLRILNSIISVLILVLIVLFSIKPKDKWTFPYLLLGVIIINFVLILLRLYFIYRRRLVTTITYNNIISEERFQRNCKYILSFFWT